MSKKIIIILLIVFAVFIGALIAIPLVFKQELLEKTKATINKQVNAEVNFDGFKLSLLRGFPKVSLELKNVVVTGKGEFRADTLLNIASARGKMSLMSLFRKSGMSIEEINLDQAVLKLVVGKTGNVNWDLALETAEEIPAEATENQESSFSLQLEKIEIKNATVFYDDREMDMLLDFSNINLSVNGKMYGTSTELLGTGKVEKFSTRYGGITYISNVALETTTRLNVDYEKMDISILENELLVNRLPLEVTGLIQMPSDSMFFDLAIKSKESGFENFLALVPPDYEEYLKDITTSGSATVSGTVKGWYFDENYPAFDLKIDVADGNFKYASLPEEIKNIKADISVSKPQGILDFTSVWIKNAHAEVKNNPVDLTLMLKNPVSDLYFDGAFVGTINFDQLKDALPLDSVNISGTIDANLFVKGNYSAIEKELYDQIKSDGMVLLDNFLYDSPAFTQKIMVPSGKLDFSPLSVNLSQFNMKVGQSDFNLSGKVYNYLNYILKDGILKGDLQLFSSFVNVNELLLLQKEEENEIKAAPAKGKKTTSPAPVGTDIEEAQESLAFTVPKNVDFTFRSKVSKAVFDRLPISNISGLITAQNGKLMLNGLNMNMLDGELKLTGSYENTPQNQPLVDLGFEILKFDIPQAYQSLSGFRKILPVAAQSEGKLSTTINMKGKLTESLKLIPTSIDGTGLFNTENLRIIESPVFNQLKGILKAEKLKNISIENFKANFVVEGGNLLLKPFSTKIAGQETTINGSLNTQNLIDMRMDFKVEREAFGTDIQNILSAIPGNKNITLVPAGVTIKGPVGKPEVKMDLSETRKTITNATKDEIKNSLNKLGDGLKKLIDK